jgi:tetratricopeptide (TPR) repeat protein
MRLLNLLGRKSANTIAPGAVKRRRELAGYFIQQGDYVSARELLSKTLERRNEIEGADSACQLLELLAWTWILEEKYQDSVAYFSKYMTAYPNEIMAYILRAGSFWYAGKLQEALDDYSKALDLDANDILAHLGRGQVFAECGEFTKAISDLDFVHENLEHSARNEPWWRSQVRAYCLSGRALAHARLGDVDRAMQEFEQSISLWPENAWVYFNRATVHESNGHGAEALTDYKLALQKATPKLSALKREHAEEKAKTMSI